MMNGARFMALRPLCTAGTDPIGDSERNPLQPRAHNFARRDGRGLARQNQKGGLEGVVRVGRIAKQTAASGQNRRSVTANEQTERRFILVNDPARKQIRIRQFARTHELMKTRQKKLTSVLHARSSSP